MKRARSVCFVTGNANKLRELKSKLESSGAAVELTSQHVDLPELQGTPEEIATKKAGEAARLICGPVLVEDTCLQFHALKGLPVSWRRSCRLVCSPVLARVPTSSGFWTRWAVKAW